ncbi:MAG: hypothetical protein PWP49_1159 [Thermococcaceae archaeon]|jgi:hypothetical protein|nr:MAG: Uncharacterized protein XD43_1247 [Thermococcales archaeon 44_46]MDN5320739.1 hypothetical protein [Thermococcaceae archaeon]HIH72241.1 hypothetical protein [Thermococcaceae archaeon]
MKNSLSAIFLIFLVFAAGCISDFSQNGFKSTSSQERSQIGCIENFDVTNFLGETWINYTLKRVYLAQTPNGGFTEIVDTVTPDIVSTYYFTKALTLLNQTPYNKAQTIKWLHEEEKTFFKNSTKTNMPNFMRLYFGVMSLSLLNETPSNREDIIDLILSYKRENGSFVDEENNDMTGKALEMLSALGYNIAELNDTKIYVLNKWSDLTPPNVDDFASVVKYISMFNMYTNMLQMLGIDYRNLKDYNQKRFPLIWISQNPSFLLENPPPLFLITPILEALKKEDLLTEDIKSATSRIIMDMKLWDGGFNLFGLDYGEPQGTYYAVKALILIGKTPDKDTIKFIHERETPLGGFIFCYQSSGDPLSTYMAVYTSKILGGEINKAKIKNYLSRAVYSRKPYSSDEPSPLYFIYLTYKELDISIDEETYKYIRNETVRLFNLYLTEKTDNIVENVGWISLIKLGKEVGIVLDDRTKKYLIDKILSQRNSDGTFGRHSGNIYKKLVYTSYAILLLEELGYKYHDDKTIEFLLNSQINGGWGAPDLYTTYQVIRALRVMEVCPKDVDGLLKFLKRVQYPYGGFNFYEEQEDAHGGLYETYLALRILELLSSS